MSATIIPFPSRQQAYKTAYRIPLYGGEVKLVVAAINLFSEYPATEQNLKTFAPKLVIECINKALVSDIFSSSTKKIFLKILASIEKEERVV